MSTQKEHSHMVRQLVKPGQEILDSLQPADAHVLHMTLGISGEAGELVDAIKKSIIYRRELDRQNVIEELGDLEFYLEGLRHALGIKRDETLVANISKLGTRYAGFKYSDAAARERADKA